MEVWERCRRPQPSLTFILLSGTSIFVAILASSGLSSAIMTYSLRIFLRSNFQNIGIAFTEFLHKFSIKPPRIHFPKKKPVPLKKPELNKVKRELEKPGKKKAVKRHEEIDVNIECNDTPFEACEWWKGHPGLYCHIGKRARDLLYKDYKSGKKLSFITNGPYGPITLSGTKRGELSLTKVKALLQYMNFRTVVKVLEEPNVEFQHWRPYVGFRWMPKLFLDFSAVVGRKDISVGTEICFDCAAESFTQYNAGLSISYANAITSLSL